MNRQIKILLLLLHIAFTCISSAQITLSHNIGNTIVETYSYGCTGGNVKWGRTFTVEDFGVNPGKDFVITSGEAAVTYENTDWDSLIQFNIYSIDENFPASFDEQNLIGSSQIVDIWMEPGPIFTLNFDAPIVIPANVERILVEVYQLYVTGYSVVFCSATAEDNDISWFKGCGLPSFEYTDMADVGYPDARFYITVTGAEADPALSAKDFTVNDINVYPNPVKSILNIEGVQCTNFTLTNMLGQKVYHDNLQPSQNTISLDNLSPGIYMIDLQSADGSVITRRIIKE